MPRIKKNLPAKSLRRQTYKKWHLSEKQNKKNILLEAELGHHTETLCPAMVSVNIIALAEVVLASHLNTRSDIPKKVECAV